MLERFSSKSEITSELFRIIMSVVNTLRYSTSVSSNRALQWSGGARWNGWVPYSCDIEVNVCQIGMPFGRSKMFPSSDSPFGPGGNDDLEPLRRHFQINAREMAAHSDAT